MEVITIEDDAAPADPITIDDDTESDCDLQQKEVNLENIEKMEVEGDFSDSEGEGYLGQPALSQEKTFASLGALSLIYTTSPCRLVSTLLGRSGMAGRTRPLARCLGSTSAFENTENRCCDDCVCNDDYTACMGLPCYHKII
ncbi:hypothetical protein E4U58_007258 [Claviceps cyperi]|nr:hypothetical protein E4U58_007258 [Claviceps cyperi]